MSVCIRKEVNGAMIEVLEKEPREAVQKIIEAMYLVGYYMSDGSGAGEEVASDTPDDETKDQEYSDQWYMEHPVPGQLIEAFGVFELCHEVVGEYVMYGYTYNTDRGQFRGAGSSPIITWSEEGGVLLYDPRRDAAKLKL